MRAIGYEPSESELQEMIEELNADADKTLNFSKFLRVVSLW